MMKIGMNLLLWTDCPTAREHGALLRNIKNWGFDGVEFPVQPMADADITAMSQQCDDLGLGRSAILALDATLFDPASSDAKLRNAAVDEIRRVIDQTHAIGADVLCGPLYQGLGRFSGNAPTEQEHDWAVEVIRRAGEYAAEAKVRLALEPLNRFEMYMVNTVAAGRKFVERVGLENVGLLADTHHSNIEEDNTVSNWDAVADKIYHVHISENHRGTPGSGHAIQPELFDMLHRRGYDGWTTIEAFSLEVPGLVPRLHLWRVPEINPEKLAREGLQFIRENINRL
jgi:D-psicose/D-tagatose/L-ribulose 3-epimerase